MGMNITAYQEKKKNKETETGKRRAGEEGKRKQAADFEEAVRCPSAVVQRARSCKNSCNYQKVFSRGPDVK